MKPLFHMTPCNILTLMCTKHYEAIVLHDTLQYPDTDMYQTLWIHCSTYTLQYHDTDMYQTLWSHCPRWQVIISWCWYVPNSMKIFFNMTRFKQIYTKHYETIVQHDTSKYHDANVYQTLWSLCSTMAPPNFLTTMMYTKYYICNVLHDTFQYRYIRNIMNLIFYMTPYNILWRGNWLIFLFVEKLCSNIIMSVCTCSYYERSTIYNTIFMSGLQCPCLWSCSLFITISLQCVSLKTSKF
jgi:hypothetical protein